MLSAPSPPSHLLSRSRDVHDPNVRLLQINDLAKVYHHAASPTPQPGCPKLPRQRIYFPGNSEHALMARATTAHPVLERALDVLSDCTRTRAECSTNACATSVLAVVPIAMDGPPPRSTAQHGGPTKMLKMLGVGTKNIRLHRKSDAGEAAGWLRPPAIKLRSAARSSRVATGL